MEAQPMSEERLAQVKALFQESYKLIYSGGAFDALSDQAEADGDVVPAVSQLVGSIINSTVKDAGVTDLGVLFGVAIMLMGELLEALQEVNIPNKEGDFELIINKAMMIVLNANPEIAQAVQSNPEIQQAMQAVGGSEGAAQSVEQGAAAGDPTAQGVMQGAQNAN